MDRNLRSRQKRGQFDEPLTNSEELTETPSSGAMEAFLEAQTRFLEQQRQFAAEEEARKKEIHAAQLQELEEKNRTRRLQEERSEEERRKREESEKMKQKLRQADHLEKWNDGDQVDAYLTKFETIMKECDIPKELLSNIMKPTKTPRNQNLNYIIKITKMPSTKK